jgi:hypothetical protein
MSCNPVNNKYLLQIRKEEIRHSTTEIAEILKILLTKEIVQDPCLKVCNVLRI